MLSLWPSYSNGRIERFVEIPRLCSSGSKSETVFPSSTRPMRWMMPFEKRSASASVVFPELPCPTRATFLILAEGNVFTPASTATVGPPVTGPGTHRRAGGRRSYRSGGTGATGRPPPHCARGSRARSRSHMLDSRWRAGVERGLRPAGARLRNIGISADQITLLGLAASVACGLTIAVGRFGWAAFFLALSGLTDVLDGSVAKSGGTAGPRGAFFDSVCDRVSDGLVLGGAAWYYAGRDSHLTVLAFAVAVFSLLVSYERARAESLGFNGKGGLMERAERMMVLGLGLTFGVMTLALWVLVVLTGVTVVHRFVLVWRQATPESGELHQPPVTRNRPTW